MVTATRRNYLRLAMVAVLATLWPYTTRAVVPPAMPYGQLVANVITFLESDVGWNGIRTNNNDPAGYAVPPYFYSFAINDGNNLNGNIGGYPGYLSVSYPGYTACVGIDAFLDWRVWSGDPAGLARAEQYANWILEHRTPVSDVYGNMPYSTQTDGVMGGGWDGAAIMTDKPAMFGLRLLRLYDITGNATYLAGATEIADVLAANQMTGAVADDGRWPFRVVPATGAVTQDYTSHLMPAVRFFDSMAAHTGNPSYGQVRDRAFAWLLANPCNPASPSYMRWEAFYEDQTPAMQTGFGDHYSGHEMIVELIKRQPTGWQDLAVTLLDTISARFLVQGTGNIYAPYEPITLEWFGWPEATYASSMQYARTALLLYNALSGDPRQNPAWYQTALDMAAVCSHGQNTRRPDGRMFTTLRDIFQHFNVDSWYEQNFNTVIYYLQMMNLEPNLAPAGEIHILQADNALTSVAYPVGNVTLADYSTATGAGTERLKMSIAPGGVYAGGVLLPRLPAVPSGTRGWYWDAVTGVVTVHHLVSPVVVSTIASAVPGDDPRHSLAQLRLRSLSPASSTQAAIGVDLAQDGRLDLAVYDLRGHLVRNLVEGESWTAGYRQVTWNGRNNQGQLVASGVYLVRGRSGQTTARTRVLQVR